MTHLPDLNKPILSYLSRVNPHSILELGSGCGHWAKIFNRPEYVGVESWGPYLVEARHLPTRIRADARLVPFRPRTFDVVLVLELLEHLTHQDGIRLLQDAKTISKKAVLVSTPADFVEQGALNGNPAERHISLWTRADLQACGFTVTEFRSSDGIWQRFWIGMCNVD